ncbi:MAG: hydroxyisourate hydrolase [Chitinophagaceae bacterium]|nr:MAG: hydroxyisourate hydrolase [Chitinophagaceae bacterium]
MDQISDLTPGPSQLTTHILDTSSGSPAKGVAIKLGRVTNGKAETITQGITNSDGRIPDLLPRGIMLAPGNYRMYFYTAAYFSKSGLDTFFPYVEITFNISGSSHYHIPLLISPYGYTTYRGS